MKLIRVQDGLVRMYVQAEPKQVTKPTEAEWSVSRIAVPRSMSYQLYLSLSRQDLSISMMLNLRDVLADVC